MARLFARSDHLGRDLVYGALAGAVGTFVLPKVTEAIKKRQPRHLVLAEKALCKEMPTHVLAGRVIRALGGDPTPERKARLGRAIHWTYGLSWGAIYAVLRDRAPFFRKALGLPFALAFTAIGDELMNTALRLTPPPQKMPRTSHVRGLAGHIAYTAATETTLRALRATLG